MTRPALHLAPTSGFLNDPTGLIHHGGHWHAYFQHSPGSTHGNVSWGHAVSDDLLTWWPHPVALAADETEDVWTGSVVHDHEDTAGFGADALVAAYTSFEPGNGHQRQALASSTDGGLTWTKHGVVLDTGTPSVRDPRLLRYDDRWLMLLARADEGVVASYTSRDLRAWSHVSDLAVGDPPGPWECPDLVRFGDRWILLVSCDGATHYLVGRFDGTTFTADPGGLRRVDQGPDCYAAVTFAVAPGGRVLLMGWLDNWAYAESLPTSPWRGQLTVARELSLVGDGSERRLVQRPVAPTREVDTRGGVELAPGLRGSYVDGAVRVEREGGGVEGFGGSWTLPTDDGTVHVVVDTCSVEVFTAEGRSASFVVLAE